MWQNRAVDIVFDGSMTDTEVRVTNPKAWSAEFPNRYQVNVTLSADGSPVHVERETLSHYPPDKHFLDVADSLASSRTGRYESIMSCC